MSNVAPTKPPPASAPADVPWLAAYIETLLEHVDDAIRDLGRDLVAVVFEGDPRGLFCHRDDALRVARERGFPYGIASPLTRPAPDGSVYVLAMGKAHGIALALLHVLPMQATGGA